MYKKLSKEGKKTLIEWYSNTKKGLSLNKTLNRLLFEGIFLIIATIVIVIAVPIADLPLWYLGVGGISLVFGLLFLIGQHMIRIKEYNKYFEHLTKNEKNKLTKYK